MKFIKNNIWTICLVALFCIFGFAGDAAAGTSIMNNATDKAKSVFGSVKKIIFVVGGFGLVGVAWAAIWGKIQWKWFGALAILAAAGSIVDYATGAGDAGLGDTFSGTKGY